MSFFENLIGKSRGHRKAYLFTTKCEFQDTRTMEAETKYRKNLLEVETEVKKRLVRSCFIRVIGVMRSSNSFSSVRVFVSQMSESIHRIYCFMQNRFEFEFFYKGVINI